MADKGVPRSAGVRHSSENPETAAFIKLSSHEELSGGELFLRLLAMNTKEVVVIASVSFKVIKYVAK